MISELQERKLDRAFGHLDVTGNGSIEWEDWIELAARITGAFGQSPASPKGTEVVSSFEQLWQTLLSNLDLDGDRRINSQEWRAGMTKSFIDNPSGYADNFRPAAVAVFGLADTDGDGVLGREEFAAFQRAFGTPDADIDAAFARLDTDGSGTLTVQELIAAAEQYYRGNDPDANGNWLYGPIG